MTTDTAKADNDAGGTSRPRPPRDRSVDGLRGLAIAAMLWGHLGIAIYHPTGHGRPGDALETIPALWMEVVGGMAPGLFTFVAGMMVTYVVRRRSASLAQMTWRGAQLLVVGALLDLLVWRIVPFTTVDILYLIGLIVPLCQLATRTPRWSRWLLGALVLALTPFVQSWLGYTDYPTEVMLSGKIYPVVPNQTSIPQHWLIDGWFPLLPWVAFGLIGTAVADGRLARGHTAADLRLALVGLTATITGVLLGFPDASARLPERMQAGGAFMPPDHGYLLVSLGGALLLLTCIDLAPRIVAGRVVRILGSAPLFAYIAHFPLVKIVARLLPARLPFAPAVSVLIAALAALTLSVMLWRGLTSRLRARLSRQP